MIQLDIWSWKKFNSDLPVLLGIDSAQKPPTWKTKIFSG